MANITIHANRTTSGKPRGIASVNVTAWRGLNGDPGHESVTLKTMEGDEVTFFLDNGEALELARVLLAAAKNPEKK